MIQHVDLQSNLTFIQSNFYPLANHKIICNSPGDTNQYTRINVILEFLKFKF